MEIIRLIEVCAVFGVPIIIICLFIENIKKYKRLKKNKVAVKKSFIFWTVILGIITALIIVFGLFVVVFFMVVTSGAVKLM